MLNQNCCSFTKIDDGQISSHGEKCGLYYKNLLELIHHIEEDHIRKYLNFYLFISF